jgi:hypothetical protein
LGFRIGQSSGECDVAISLYPADWPFAIFKVLTGEHHVPAGAIIYADKAYNGYEVEDLLKEIDHIQLLPMRKKNAKRALPPSVAFVQHYHRKRIERYPLKAGQFMASMT